MRLLLCSASLVNLSYLSLRGDLMKLLTIALLFFVVCLNAFAEESKICVITSDIDAEQTDMLIDVDAAGTLDTIRLYKTMDKRVVSDESHPVERVMQDGVVASERQGR